MIQETKNIKTRVQQNYDWWTQSSNFNPDQLTVLMLTGTSALTRGTAFQMEKNGIDFPLKNIAEILHQADILHVSHEVPMFEECPPAVPLREEMRFCSDPKNIDLFKMLGVDIVELTGNHLLDWGPEAFLETLSLYNRQGLLVYGAGMNPETASSGLEITDHGNRFVFFGCNISGPENVWVSDERPGVQKCDQEFLNGQIAYYKQQGFLPIVTYQHYELDGFTPNPQLQADFWQSAIAGAVVVSGSQAHFPQGFDFVNGSFIDYGVGNLFFDQMQTWYRKATIDTHYFYNGSYINTALRPIINENQGQPRLMTIEESERFLSKLYENSFYEKK
jgi:poly-gamma-glutamate synthesis protein (capsule biosynthesis protein)